MLSDYINEFSEFRDALWDNRYAAIFAAVLLVLLILFRGKLARGVGKALKKAFRKWPVVAQVCYDSVVGPLKTFFVLLGIFLVFEIIQPTAGHVVFSLSMMTFVNKAFRIACIVIATWILINFTPTISKVMLHSNGVSRMATAVTIRFTSNVVKFIIVSLGVVIIISELGYNINGIITGLGLGGLTISLAAKNTASNLFAGAEIVADRPFDVGDYIITPSVEGTVEDMNMRSTRIRTKDDLLIIVPNANLMSEAITNSTAMHKRYRSTTISLTYRTKTETIIEIRDAIYEMLRAREDIDQDRIVVRFNGFGESGLDLQVLYFTRTTNYDEFLKVNEDVDLLIRKIVEEHGADFAFPSTSVYLENEESKV